MRPYTPERVSSLSPPRPPPKTPQKSQPPQPSLAATGRLPPKPPGIRSPIRRKPLPTSALTASPVESPTSPNGGVTATPQNYPQTNGHHRSATKDSQGSSSLYSTSSGTAQGTPRRAQTRVEPPATVIEPKPTQPLTISTPPIETPQGNEEQILGPVDDSMALKPGARPPPLRMDSASSAKSLSAHDAKKPTTPGGKVSSFFGWKRTASPSTDSLSTENSDVGRSPGPSPFTGSPQTSAYSTHIVSGSADDTKRNATSDGAETNGFGGPLHRPGQGSEDLTTKIGVLEGELREISLELAGSIRREMELEDLVERLQLEGPPASGNADRTSDYFSDSGTSSIRPPGSEIGSKDDVDKIKRDMEQQKALIRVDLSRKWQEERTRRKALESHVKILEDQISSSRRDKTQSADLAAKTKELEASLDDARRRLTQERKTKENFEDLLTALKVELEQHRNERDNLRDEVVPHLKSQLEAFEGSFSDSQKQPYDVARLQQEIKRLREENLSLMQKSGMGMQSIAEDGSSLFGLARSNSRTGPRGGLTRSGSVSRSNTAQDTGEPLTDKLNAVEQQRDALHVTVKYLLRRQEHQRRQTEKKLKVLELEKESAITSGSPHKHGYEREVRGLRTEINLLRRRADDALEQKWQCEKGLGGLAMDLDRSRQETAGLRQLLQEKDGNTSGSAFLSLEHAYDQLQVARRSMESSKFIAAEQKWADKLEGSVERQATLSSQVKEQLSANTSLRNRLKQAVERGELNQQASATQINELQVKLRKLEDTITAAQTQSETAVMKHEEDVRVLRASTNVQLLRASETGLTPNSRSPLTPLFSNNKRSPRLDKTSTGPGVALHQALKTEYLEHKVAELEQALSEAEKEMEEVVGRMNTAQISVAELQTERDEALRQSRKLQAAVQAEQVKVQSLIGR